ncbi:MAG TPA: energy transducer TonB [Pyrinomonadaceae bacterium]|jgi:TonB family protein
MSCFLKRILPFTLTLIVGIAIGGIFNIFSFRQQSGPAALRVESDYGTSGGSGAGSYGCRSRRRSYSESYSPARVLTQVEPAYTTEARRNGTEGQVMLRVTLKADGTVGDVETITSLPDGLTEQARKAARLIKFVPATRYGSPVDEQKTITYSFDID